MKALPILQLLFITNILARNNDYETDKSERLISSSQDLIHQMQLKIQNLEASVSQLKINTQPNAAIGFLATLTHQMTSLPRDSAVIFNHVVTNDGGGYNTLTGIFTCPEDGLYSFSWTTLTDPGSIFHTEFSVNGVSISKSHNNAAGIHVSKAATKNVVVHLRKGNRAWVKIIGQYGQLVHGDTYSSFSGFKI